MEQSTSFCFGSGGYYDIVEAMAFDKNIAIHGQWSALGIIKHVVREIRVAGDSGSDFWKNEICGVSINQKDHVTHVKADCG